MPRSPDRVDCRTAKIRTLFLDVIERGYPAAEYATFNLLGGFLQPTSGSVQITASHFGWFPQATIVDWPLTAKENVALGPRPHGFPRAKGETPFLCPPTTSKP